MSTATKRRVVAVALAVFAAWPLAHRVIVARYDVSPWRFFGWAMYCQPKIPIAVDVRVRIDGAVLPLADASGDAGELMRRRFEFAQRRQTWGELLPPDDLAGHILGALPQGEGVEVVVSRLVLDPATSRLTARTESYEYVRR